MPCKGKEDKVEVKKDDFPADFGAFAAIYFRPRNSKNSWSFYIAYRAATMVDAAKRCEADKNIDATRFETCICCGTFTHEVESTLKLIPISG